jgi:hypothetical protein
MIYLKNTADLSDHRIEMFDGDEHLVIPVVAAVQGVMNKQFLPISSLEASLPAWEGVAVTLAHPKEHGNEVSANTQHSVENFVVGKFFNAHVDDNKFKGEFWINLQKLEGHDDGELFLELVEQGVTIEVSTSYWANQNNRGGIYKGKNYNGTQTDLVPNHIAILLHETGACSVADGCGTPRTNKKEPDMADEKLSDEERGALIIAKLRSEPGFGSLIRDVVGSDMTDNAEHGISHDQIRRDLRELITMEERSDAFVFIVDVFDTQVVYGRELPSGEVDLFSRTYSIVNGDKPDFSIDLDEPVEVRQVVTFEPVSNSQEEESHMENRDALIERLVANEGTPFDAEQLAAMTDDQISHLATNLEEEPTGEAEGTPIGTPAAEPKADGEAASATEPVQNSAGGLSPEVSESLNKLGTDGIEQIVNASAEMAQHRKAAHDGLVSRLVANEKVTMDESILRRMDLEGLQGVARMVGIGVDQSARGGPVVNTEKRSGPPPAPSIVLGDPKDD